MIVIRETLQNSVIEQNLRNLYFSAKQQASLQDRKSGEKLDSTFLLWSLTLNINFK